tara:strand:+ start:1251 stop:1700 length:450 start_codon:yes stop_codon:yes gene_type:complete
MGYNKFRWWTNGRHKKVLPASEPLLLRIKNGDFEYSPYFKEGYDNLKLAKDIYDKTLKTSNAVNRHREAFDASKMKRVKYLRLMEEADFHETKRLVLLRKALTKEFGKDYWDEAMKRQRGKGTTEDLYWWYKKKSKMGTTPSEIKLQLR